MTRPWGGRGQQWPEGDTQQALGWAPLLMGGQVAAAAAERHNEPRVLSREPQDWPKPTGTRWLSCLSEHVSPLQNPLLTHSYPTAPFLSPNRRSKAPPLAGIFKSFHSIRHHHLGVG